MEIIWNKAKEELKERVDRKDFLSWIEPIKFSSQNDKNVILKSPNNFVKRWFIDNYIDSITEIFKDFTEQVPEFIVDIEESCDQGQLNFGAKILGKATTNERKERPIANKSKQIGLIEKYSFDTFIEGPSNQFARAASLSVAKKPGNAFNPLFIYGGVGLGKTHLINSIGNAVAKNNPDFRIVTLSSERFMNELINSIHHNRVNAFRKKYRQCDLLLIDDIQFLAGKERTQEEFFHTFNSLHESGNQIVLTSDRFPKDIPELEERLRSRFSWGLVADIQPPELETRLAILREKAKQEKVDMPDDVAFFLASKIVDNIRELEGAFIRLSAFSSFNGNTISMEMAKKVLRNMIGDSDRIITVDMIQKSVCDYFKVKLSDLKSARRQKIIAVPRQIGMYLARKLTDSSFPNIGQQFGGRDHSTVIHACNKIEKQREQDTTLLQAIEIIEKTIRA